MMRIYYWKLFAFMLVLRHGKSWLLYFCTIAVKSLVAVLQLSKVVVKYKMIKDCFEIDGTWN